MTISTGRPVGDLLREWRLRRRMSQLDLACDAGISARHLSLVETGRAEASRGLVLHLCERLDVPLRDRNLLLAAAGLAPQYPDRPLEDPALLAARAGIDAVLAGHDPHPALAIDRRWTVIAANAALWRLIGGVDPTLLHTPMNLLRLCLHPGGLAPRIANLTEWRDHLVVRLRRQFEQSGDAALNDLLEEIQDYPVPRQLPADPPSCPAPAGVAVPFCLVTIDGTLNFLTTTTVFCTPRDVTLAELAIEAYLPADAETAEIMRRQAAAIMPAGEAPRAAAD